MERRFEETVTVEDNYVGKIIEKCAKYGVPAPTFLEAEENSEIALGKYKCTCKFQGWSIEGFGQSKKLAKQHSAKLTLLKAIQENVLGNMNENNNTTNLGPISKLIEYSFAKKIDPPMFSEKGKEGELFLIECLWNDFTCVGKGSKKKKAKESAANEMVKHFNIAEYFYDKMKLKERQMLLKTPVSKLLEHCSANKISISFNEEKTLFNKKEAFIVTCTAGDLRSKSNVNFSKKYAKIEVASKMLDLLNSRCNTLEAFPKGKRLFPQELKVSDDENNDDDEEEEQQKICLKKLKLC